MFLFKFYREKELKCSIDASSEHTGINVKYFYDVSGTVAQDSITIYYRKIIIFNLKLTDLHLNF